MIDEQSSASGHDYASDRSAIGAGNRISVGVRVLKTVKTVAQQLNKDIIVIELLIRQLLCNILGRLIEI